MRTVSFGGTQVNLKATPLSMLYHRQAFGTDLTTVVTKFANAPTIDELDKVEFLQVAWAMAKSAAGPGSAFPSFEEWVGALEEYDVSNQDLYDGVMDEAIDGFFRTSRDRRRRQAEEAAGGQEDS